MSNPFCRVVLASALFCCALIARAFDAAACMTDRRFDPTGIDRAAVIFRGTIVSATIENFTTDRFRLLSAVAHFETIETYKGQQRKTWSFDLGPANGKSVEQIKKQFTTDLVIGLEAPPPVGPAVLIGDGMCAPKLMVEYGLHDHDYDGIMEQLWIKGIVPWPPAGKKLELVSPAEIERFRNELAAARLAEAIDVRFRAKAAACALPPVPAGVQVLAIGAGGGNGVATLAFDDLNVRARVADVVIEDGERPLYIAARTNDPTIWRVSGRIDRVKVFVTSSGRRVSTGVAGLPSEVVSSPGPPDCLSSSDEAAGLLRSHRMPYETVDQLRSVDIRNVKARELEILLGVRPIHVAEAVEDRPNAGVRTRYASRFRLPSGQIDLAVRLDGARTTSEVGDAGVLWKYFTDNVPGGVIDIDPASVVSRGGVHTLHQLPLDAGFAELIESGTLEPIGWRCTVSIQGGILTTKDCAERSHLPSYQSFPFVFRVKKPMRMPPMPAIFHLAYPRLILPVDVPMPEGNPDRVCIRREPIEGPLDYCPGER